MSNLFPCPNETCSYKFDKAALPPAAMVTCPVCRTRFPYRDGQVITQAAPAVAAPVPVSNVPDWAAESFGGIGAPEAPGALVTKYETPKGGMGKTILVLIGGTAFLLVTLLTVFYMIRRNPLDSSSQATGVKKDDKFNFVFDQPGAAWQNDTDVRARLDVNAICLKHSNPDGWVALMARDYQDRNPRPKEIELLMHERLRKFLGDTYEKEERSGPDKKLAGLPARYFVFNGDADGKQVSGECHILINKGIAYLFFAWAPSDVVKDLADEFADMRSRFGIANFRDNWTEQRINVRTFFLKDGNYQVSDDEDVWIARTIDQEKPAMTKKDFIDDPKNYDPAATIALRGRLPVKNPRSRGIDFVPECEAQVVELPKGNPEETARKHLEERIAKEEAGAESKSVLTEAKDSPSETPLPDKGAKVVKYWARDPKSPSTNKFYVVSAIDTGKKTVAVIASSSSKDAKFMEPYMLKLAASLAEK